MSAHRRVLAAALAWVALMAAGSLQAAPPRHLKLYYDLSYNGTVMAEGTETLDHDGRTYRVESETRGKGLFALVQRGSVKRVSRGEVLATGLRPQEFRDQRGDRTPEFARFDWDKRLVVHERDGRSDTTPATESMQDRVSFLWSFAFLPVSGAVNVQVADGRGTTQFRYANAGREVLKTAAGDLDTVHMVKQKDSGDSRGTELWLAVQYSFAPVRLLVTEKDGSRVDQIVTRIEP